MTSPTTSEQADLFRLTPDPTDARPVVPATCRGSLSTTLRTLGVPVMIGPTTSEQEALFAAPVDPEPAALPYTHADPGPVSPTLVGDGYRWLTGILPAPRPVRCTAHRVRMRLDTAARLLWVCPRCDTEALDDAPATGTNQTGAAA